MTPTSKSTAILFALPLALLASTLPSYAESRDFEFSNFDQISASAGIAVEVTHSSEFSVRVEANNGSDFDNLVISQNGAELSLSIDHGSWSILAPGALLSFLFHDDLELTAYVTMPALERANASSGANLLVTGLSGPALSASSSSGAGITLADITYENVELNASSGADVDASGTCISLSGSSSSGADVYAGELECSAANISASSGADYSAFAAQSVSANASSGADVTVYGNPEQTDINASSGGDVHLRR